ncbi:glycosyltransferase family 2 protein [Legionella norrlandica]|uniref:glycosyltransferase family 2 protein n=1 Tax=Legionella norrlandica TaxID=1498499 RepID=UPI000566FFC7|nr:hypothetical protein [Legionella norrlandica]
MSCAALLLSFNSKDFISRTIEALNTHEPAVDIYVIDNNTETSETEIIPTLDRYLSENCIKGYCAFQNNIINNACTVAFIEDVFGLVGRYTHILVSDGDIEVLSPFLDEQMLILSNDEISCCALQVDIRFWPTSDPSYLLFLTITLKYWQRSKRRKNTLLPKVGSGCVYMNWSFSWILSKYSMKMGLGFVMDLSINMLKCDIIHIAP